jgi:diacylglycerol kinase (ATP)
MLVISAISIIGGFYFKITKTEWLISLILITGVFSLELFNTAIERFLDLFYPEKNETVKSIKDLMAGGVAIVSIGACIIGFVIFLPKILTLI